MIRPVAIAFTLISAATLFSTGCSDEGDEPQGELPGPTTTQSPNGVTPCGSHPDNQPNSCAAGQYCADEIFSECVNGCLSNSNCADDQICVKDVGVEAGSCQAAPTSTSCTDVCSKMQACIPSTTQAQCDQFCNGANEACKSCVVGENCPSLIDGTACTSECGF